MVMNKDVVRMLRCLHNLGVAGDELFVCHPGVQGHDKIFGELVAELERMGNKYCRLASQSHVLARKDEHEQEKRGHDA